MNEDLYASIEATRRRKPPKTKRTTNARPRAKTVSRPTANGSVHPIWHIFLTLAWPLMLVGALGWWFVPGKESSFFYDRSRIMSQIDQRIGQDIGTGYALLAIDPFPPADSNYDYSVVLSGGGRKATAVAVGTFSYDPNDASIKVTRPSDIRKGSIDPTESTYVAAVAGTPKFIQTPVKSIASWLDARNDITSGAEAQSYARGLPIFRIPDEDKAKMMAVNFSHVVRRNDGMALYYTEGTSLFGWFFVGVFLAGVASRACRRF